MPEVDCFRASISGQGSCNPNLNFEVSKMTSKELRRAHGVRSGMSLKQEIGGWDFFRVGVPTKQIRIVTPHLPRHLPLPLNPPFKKIEACNGQWPNGGLPPPGRKGRPNKRATPYIYIFITRPKPLGPDSGPPSSQKRSKYIFRIDDHPDLLIWEGGQSSNPKKNSGIHSLRSTVC